MVSVPLGEGQGEGAWHEVRTESVRDRVDWP